ncbi:very short patch repair endonuclease [Photobacterium lutimaris]|uniref:Very short patch repair endonuclease n=1 Tax=Photobacterium lutimaris TaxID=388278 RepID=A0A2T3IU13_9GAMM|nr:very short patch repair endonuclease [Photobacterium lutimaris]TDR73363.1 T/G mismatch-specific endonuclease [Photobacterium lutimaris]
MPDMSLFCSRDTKLEVFLRKLLFARGFRYRMHDRKLKGRPDLVFPKYKAVIFVHGCFWHAHSGCSRFTFPKKNKKFWLAKFRANRLRDKLSTHWLKAHGWRVLVVWECAIRKPADYDIDQLLDFITCWLVANCHSCEVSGGAPLPLLKLNFDTYKVTKLQLIGNSRR